MRLSLKRGSAARATLALGCVSACLFAAPQGLFPGERSFGDPADPGINPWLMDELLSVPVPSVRAALATNPSLPDDSLRVLAWDDYDIVSLAAQEQWKTRHPLQREKLTLARDSGKKSAFPDYGQMREMIENNREVDAAMAWRGLPADLQARLVDVCHWEKASDKLERLLDFIVMAEPPGGPLASAMFFQLMSKDPERVSEMRKRGLLGGINAFDLYSRAVEAHDLKLIRFFADSGFSVNGRGADGATPLMAAARAGNVDVVLLLLDLGAKADAKDDNSLAATDYARRSLKVDAAEFLSLSPEDKAKADKLKQRFSPAPRDSRWVGRWVANSSAAKPQIFAFVIFGRDGTFDMPPGPAGQWSEVDATHLSATPMLKEESSPGSQRTLYGSLTFERLEDPKLIRAKYHDVVLEFHPESEDAATVAKASVPAPVAKPSDGTLPPPTGLKAAASLERISMSWDAAERAKGYVIYRGGALLTPELIEGQEFMDDAPPGAVTATYTVRSVDAVLRLSSQSAPVTVRTILRDTDGRGLPDRWQILYFGHLGVDPNADPDGDGLTNLEEYKMGTDPNDFYNGVEPVIKSPYGPKPGPEDQLAIVVLHPDGRPWVNAPCPFNVTSGRRGVSIVRNQPPYIKQAIVRTDKDGLAQVFLEPLRTE